LTWSLLHFGQWGGRMRISLRKTKDIFLWGLVLTWVGLVFFGAHVKAAESGEVLTAGCKTAYFMMVDLTDEFRQKSHLTLMPKRSGNKVAAKLLAAGQISFAYMCEPHHEVTEKFKIDPNQTSGWVSREVAKDPIVIVVNKDNPTTNLTKSQVTDIFSGKIINWKEVGGADEEVKVTYQEDSLSSGVLGVFKEKTVGKDGTLAKNAVRFQGPKKRGAYVARNPGAVTFMGLAAYQERYGKLLDIDGVAPTRANIVKGTYPIAATYYIVFDRHDTDNRQAESFLNFLASPEGIAAINKNFVALAQ
jgi:ABC-type phosphate transport system substrate-binding protein